MNNIKSVLVTGAAGYIGSVLVHQLLAKGYNVVGFDNLRFGGEALLGVLNHPAFSFCKGDVRNVKDLQNLISHVDAIVHLAAIVGDPACKKEPQLAKGTNWEGSKLVFDLASASSNIRNFVFASTCSNYGKMEGTDYVKEDSPLNPVSLYANLKVKFENYIQSSTTRPDFIPTSLRFATVYGISPRMRFDLTVNEFIRDAALGKELVIFGEQFWRPYTHVEDLARACMLVLESAPQKVDHKVFGVGNTNENYTKKMIADEILKIIPEARILYVHKDEDPRDYRVNFERIQNELGYQTIKTVPEGLKELYKVIHDGILVDSQNSKYCNT
jgi:nucleoside-diphosphate-sugar epimerase